MAVIVSAGDTISLLSTNGSFLWQEADAVGKVKRLDLAPPGEAEWLSSREQILGLCKECHSLKGSLF